MSRLKEFNLSVGGVVLDGRHLIAIGVSIILVVSCCTFFIKSALDSQVSGYEPYQDKVKSLESFSGYSKAESGGKGSLYIEGKGLVEASTGSTGESYGYGGGDQNGESSGIGSINMVSMGSGSTFDWNGGSNYLNATE